MKSGAMTIEDVRIQGLEALKRKLGPIGMVRFLQQYHHGYGDYTRERRKLMSNTSVREIAKRIRIHSRKPRI